MWRHNNLISHSGRAAHDGKINSVIGQTDWSAFDKEFQPTSGFQGVWKRITAKQGYERRP